MMTRCLVFITVYIIGNPVAWLLSDREDTATMECFLQAVKLKSPDIKINTAMTDDGKNSTSY